MKVIDYSTYKKPSDYIKFPEGDSTIRVISEGFMGMQHGLRSSRGWVNLGVCTEDATCEHCKKGNEAKRFWKWIVADRKTNEVYMLDAGIMLGDQICQIALIHGDPKKYDITITRQGQKLNTKYSAKKSDKDISVTQEELSRWASMRQFIKNKYLKG